MIVATTRHGLQHAAPTAPQEPRDFRFRVALVHEGGRWLTSDIEFVGDSP